jgi:hypothetical protein
MAKSSRAPTDRAPEPPEETRRVPTEAEVRERAHALWVAEGMPEGREVDNWMRARRELEREAGLD